MEEGPGRFIRQFGKKEANTKKGGEKNQERTQTCAESHIKQGGAPVATNKEQRPSEAEETRGREMVSAPECCSDEKEGTGQRRLRVGEQAGDRLKRSERR